MPEEVVVGVDVGSGGSRAVAMTRRGVVVAEGSAVHADAGLPIGEADPAIWAHGAAQAIAALGVAPAAIGIGGQGPVTVDLAGRRAVTFRHPAAATGDGLEQPLAQANTLASLLPHPVEPRQLWDWLVAAFGGDRDAQSVWPGATLLAGFGGPRPVGAPAGVTDGSHGLPPGIPLVPGCNDAFMTAWASGIDRPGKGFDPGGTTGGLGVAIAAAEHPQAAAFGMAAHVGGVVIVGGPVAAHGAMLTWWSEVTGRPVGELITEAAGVAPGAAGVMVLPFFEGERAPRWNPLLQAEIVGLTLRHGREVITRALLEASAYGLAHIARTLAVEGIALDRVVCSGGPSRSRLWTEIKAAVLEVPCDVPACAEMAAYGAALTAGAGVGWWPRPGDGRAGDWPLPDMTTIAPEPLGVYRANVDRFIALGDAAVARLT